MAKATSVVNTPKEMVYNHVLGCKLESVGLGTSPTVPTTWGPIKVATPRGASLSTASLQISQRLEGTRQVICAEFTCGDDEQTLRHADLKVQMLARVLVHGEEREAKESVEGSVTAVFSRSAPGRRPLVLSMQRQAIDIGFEEADERLDMVITVYFDWIDPVETRAAFCASECPLSTLQTITLLNMGFNMCRPELCPAR